MEMIDFVKNAAAEAVIGASALLLITKIVFPLFVDFFYFRSAKISGTWKAEITATTPDGKEQKNSELIHVKQIGNKIWGHTEIGTDLLFESLAPGNKFSGHISHGTISIKFNSRNWKLPYSGVFLAKLESPRKARGFSIARLDEHWPIQAVFSLEKMD